MSQRKRLVTVSLQCSVGDAYIVQKT